MKKLIISSPKKMLQFGEQLSKKYNKILLYGDLGVGKTQLVKGFAKGLNLSTNIIQSPTYTYINIYENKLLHIDMFRLENINDLIEKGILQEIDNFNYIAIERPKWESYYINKDWLKIIIKKLSTNKREVILER